MMFALLAVLGSSAYKNPRLSGSFIQDWYFMWWDAARWDKEIAMYKNIGLEYIILQSTITQDYPDKNETGDNWESYDIILANSRKMYPSNVFDYYYSTHDSLKLCFDACRKYGIKVFVGTIYDDRWWYYGWDINNIEYYKTWVEHNSAENKKAIEEIWSMYSGYADVIAGWYNVNEIWNIHSACLNIDDNKYAEIVGSMLHNFSQIVHSITPNLPIMTSPFVNYEISTPEQNGEWWFRLLQAADLRPIDIVVPQDSVGAQYDRHPDGLENVESWIKSWSEGVKNNSVRFWVNHENFRSTSGGGADIAKIEDFQTQLDVSDPYVEKHVVFALSHYGSLYDSSGSDLDPTWFNALKSYLEEEIVLPSPSESLQNNTDSQEPDNGSNNLGLYIGIPVGVLVAAAILGFIVYYRRKNDIEHEIEV